MKLQPVNGSVLHIFENYEFQFDKSLECWLLSTRNIPTLNSWSPYILIDSSHGPEFAYSIAFSFRISFVIFLLCVISSSLVPTIISDVLSSVSNAFDIVNMHPLHVYINYSKKRYNKKCSSSRMFWLKLDSFHYRDLQTKQLMFQYLYWMNSQKNK